MNRFGLIEQINAKMITLESDVEALATRIGNLDTTTGGLDTAVGTLETAVGALESAVESLTNAAYASTDTEVLNEALTVSGGPTPSYTSADIACAGASVAAVQIKNKGTSTSVVCNVFGDIAGVGYTDTAIGTFTLTATPGATCKNFVLSTVPYDAIKVVATNGDAANTATLDIVIRVIKKAVV